MNPKPFLAGLALTLLFQIVINLLMLRLMEPLREHTGFIFTSIVVMAVFCISLYGAARVMARSSLTRLFIQLVMIAVFLKLFVCLALIVGYKEGFDPTNTSFIWSFLLIYISSTIYEVIFLEKVGRQKQKPAS